MLVIDESFKFVQGIEGEGLVGVIFLPPAGVSVLLRDVSAELIPPSLPTEGPR